MQKVVDFLERYCQWVAVGIGAIFFLFALYQYLPVVSTPVTVELGSEKFTPGEVDREILQSVADPLDARMSDQAKPTITVPNYAAQITERMSAAPKVEPLSGAMAAARPVQLPDLPWDVKPTDQAGPQQITIPELPVAILDPQPTTGFAQVTPVIPQPGGVPAVPNPAGGNKDVTWVRVPFTISMGQMDRGFRAANIPGALSNTNFVRVDLVRQRQLPSGGWGPEEVVAPIETAGILPLPAQQGPAALIAYNQWAIQHQQQIIQPPFYPFLAGDPPFQAPGAPVNPAAPEGGDPGLGSFNPETYPANGPLDSLTPEQKKAVVAVRQRRAKEAEEQRRSQRPQGGEGTRGGRGGGGPGGGGGAGGGGRGGKSDDGSSHGGQLIPFQYVPGNPGAPGGPGGGYPGGGYPGGGYPGGGYPGGGYPGEGMPSAPTNEMNLPPVQNIQFIPQAGMPDIMGHAFDMNAKAGATYRYRIRYSIANPLFNAAAAGIGPQLAGVFEIVSEDRAKWSESVTVKSNTHVFLQTTPSAAGNLVRFTIFHWQNGKWNRSNQTFSPGDSVGKVDGEVDYRSTLTLVDVRKDSTSDRSYALLMADDGSIEKHDYDTDKDSKQFKDLTLAVDGPPVPVTPTEGVPGGGYPGGGYPGGGYPGGGYPGGGYPGGGYPGAGGARP